MEKLQKITKVKFNNIIGLYIDPTSLEGIPTDTGVVVSNPDGSHIVPANPKIDALDGFLSSQLLFHSIDRAIKDNNKNLEALAAKIDNNNLIIHFFLSSKPDNDTVNLLQTIEAEILADFPGVENIESEWGIAPSAYSEKDKLDVFKIIH